MESTATDAAAYPAEAPAERHVVRCAIRKLCRDRPSGYVESRRDGTPEFAFASQKHDISLFCLRRVAPDPVRAELKGAQIAKCGIRYGKPGAVDLLVLADLPRATTASRGEVC